MIWVLISLATYFRLRMALALANTTFGSSEVVKPQSIGTFFASYKKGSKFCRKILGNIDPVKTVSKLQVLSTFFALINEPAPEYKNVFSFLPLWNTNGLPNRMRDFLFKFFNNQLGLNTRTSHFGGESRSCTFCVLLKKQDPPEESFSHLFFHCEVVKNLHTTFENTAFLLHHGEKKISKASWFGVEKLDKENKFRRLLFLTVQFLLWEAKLQKKLPEANYFLGETIFLLENALRTDGQLRLDKINVNCVISRHWDTLRELRW